MRLNMPRESYIPAGAVPIADTESDAIAFTYETAGVLYGLAFHGKAAKPDWHFRFAIDERRASKIAEHAAGRRANAVYQTEAKAKRAAPVALKVGDVLNTSWGYDQTNVEFFQVTALVGARMVEIREIAGAMVDGGGLSMAGYTTAIRDKFIGEPTRHIVTYGNSVKISSCCQASPWDGKPHYVSWYA